MLRTVERFKQGLDVFLRWFCIILFAVLVLLVTYQVFVRQVLQSGSAWTEVLSRVVFVWQGLIGAAYVIGEKDDVAIDFLVRKLPEAAVKAIEVLAHAVIGGFALWVMVLGGWRLAASTMSDIVQLLPVSQGVLYLAVPVAGAIIVLYSVIHVIQTIAKPHEPPRDPDTMDLTNLREESI